MKYFIILLYSYYVLPFYIAAGCVKYFTVLGIIDSLFGFDLNFLCYVELHIRLNLKPN